MKYVNHSKGKVGVRNTSLETSRSIEETPTGNISAAEATIHTQELNIHPSNQHKMDLRPTYKTKKHVTEKKVLYFKTNVSQNLILQNNAQYHLYIANTFLPCYLFFIIFVFSFVTVALL